MKRTLLFFTAAILMISGASCQSKDNTSNQQRVLKAQQTITPVEVAAIDGLDRAYFASGCFWCVEAVYESLKGVKRIYLWIQRRTHTKPYLRLQQHRKNWSCRSRRNNLQCSRDSFFRFGGRLFWITKH